MKLEQISNNKIQVSISKTDLETNDINFHSIMCNSNSTQQFFTSILNLAEEELGFITTNYDIVIETVVLNDSSLIFTISRSKSSEKHLHNYPNVSRKNYSNHKCFLFNSFDDFYEFYNLVKFKGVFKKTLYYFNNKFYYIANNISSKSKKLICEYALPIKLPISLIKEYGKQVL